MCRITSILSFTNRKSNFKTLGIYSYRVIVLKKAEITFGNINSLLPREITLRGLETVSHLSIVFTFGRCSCAKSCFPFISLLTSYLNEDVFILDDKRAYVNRAQKWSTPSSFWTVLNPTGYVMGICKGNRTMYEKMLP